MKRGGPLKRTTPLARGKGLGRGTKNLERGKALAAKPLEREEAKRRALVRGAVFARDGFACVLAARPEALEVLGPCFGRLTYHHVRKAGQGGPYTLENGLTLCLGHNGAVEDHPTAAHLLGLVDRSTPPHPGR